MTVVHDVEEHVGRVGAVGEIADLVDDEKARMRVGCECLGESSLTEGGGEIIDELGGGREKRIESVLDRTIGDGDSQVGLAAAGEAEGRRLGLDRLRRLGGSGAGGGGPGLPRTPDPRQS